jgi:hypothetical protein
MENDFCGENGESKAKHRAKKFFQMLTEQRRKAKEERDREKQRQRREDVFRKMQELQGGTEVSKQPIQRVLHPPSTSEPMNLYPPDSTAQEPPKPSDKPAQLHPADLDFWRWAVGKGEEEEPPAWTWRNRLLYKGAKW